MAREALSSATFRCEDRAAIVRYCGGRLWELSSPASNWAGPHENVAAAIRETLGLGDEIPYNTKVVEVIAERATGTIKNDTFPTDRWFVDLNGDRPWAGAEKGLDAAIMACLVALKLRPIREPTVSSGGFDRARPRMATFLVQSKLRIRSRPGFYLLGEMLSGTVQAGMVANRSV